MSEELEEAIAALARLEATLTVTATMIAKQWAERQRTIARLKQKEPPKGRP